MKYTALMKDNSYFVSLIKKFKKFSTTPDRILDWVEEFDQSPDQYLCELIDNGHTSELIRTSKLMVNVLDISLSLRDEFMPYLQEVFSEKAKHKNLREVVDCYYYGLSNDSTTFYITFFCLVYFVKNCTEKDSQEWAIANVSYLLFINAYYYENIKSKGINFDQYKKYLERESYDVYSGNISSFERYIHSTICSRIREYSDPSFDGRIFTANTYDLFGSEFSNATKKFERKLKLKLQMFEI